MKTNVNKKFGILGIIGSVLLATSCSKTEYVETDAAIAGETSLVFDARFGDADFELNKAYDYHLTNPSGEFDLQYKFGQLRYWVSNVKLVNVAGEEVAIPDSYYLVEENNEINIQDGSYNKVYPAGKREEVVVKNIPNGEYKSIKFSIGVDPKYNDNLALRAGELNSLNGMAFESWMWFTSYKFFALNGEMTWVKDEPGTQEFFWDYASNDLYATKEVAFDQPITINSQTKTSINLEVDVEKIIALEYPWANRLISATTPELMKELKDNLVNDAITLKGVTEAKR